MVVPLLRTKEGAWQQGASAPTSVSNRRNGKNRDSLTFWEYFREMPHAMIKYQVEIPGNSWKQNIPDDFASRSVFCGVVCPKKGMGSRYHETPNSYKISLANPQPSF